MTRHRHSFGRWCGISIPYLFGFAALVLFGVFVLDLIGWVEVGK